MKVQKVSFEKLKQLNFSGVSQKNYELKNLTTFKIGGKAKIYLEICTLECFIKVMLYLKDFKTQIFVLGNGSNVLVSDRGFDGIVIKLKGDFCRFEQFDNIVEMGAGVLLSEAYKYCQKLGLSGFEESVGIPATIGGAVCMNASAYNFEMAKIIDYVVAYDFQKIVYLKNNDCNFSYRHSIFSGGKYIILRVGFSLNSLDSKIMLSRTQETIQKRLASQPKGYCAGCIFRRKEGLNISRMLDDMGAKNMRVGGAYVSSKHANFIMNDGTATSSDILELIKLIKTKFNQTYGFDIDCEIKFLGE